MILPYKHFSLSLGICGTRLLIPQNWIKQVKKLLTLKTTTSRDVARSSFISNKHKSVYISLFKVGLISFWFALCQVLDCDFDDSTFCQWANENSGKSKFNWTLKSGQTPSWGTGPISDVSGINSLFYIDSLVAPNVYLNFQALSVYLR